MSGYLVCSECGECYFPRHLTGTRLPSHATKCPGCCLGMPR